MNMPCATKPSVQELHLQQTSTKLHPLTPPNTSPDKVPKAAKPQNPNYVDPAPTDFMGPQRCVGSMAVPLGSPSHLYCLGDSLALRPVTRRAPSPTIKSNTRQILIIQTPYKRAHIMGTLLHVRGLGVFTITGGSRSCRSASLRGLLLVRTPAPRPGSIPERLYSAIKASQMK